MLMVLLGLSSFVIVVVQVPDIAVAPVLFVQSLFFILFPMGFSRLVVLLAGL